VLEKNAIALFNTLYHLDIEKKKNAASEESAKFSTVQTLRFEELDILNDQKNVD
jgi:hypothetical protein